MTDGRSNLRRRLRIDAQSAGVVFGVIGMLTGVAGLLLAWQTKSEQSTVLLAAYPTAAASDLTHEGLAVRVEIVNQSLRPVIIRGASLWSGSRKIGDATGFLSDLAVLDRSDADPSGVSRSRLRLPITVDARAGRALAVLIDVWRPVVTAGTGPEQRSARRALNEFMAEVSRLSDADSDSIQLRVDRVPGGSQWFAVRGIVPAAVYPEAIRDVNAAAATTPAPLWVVERVVVRDELRGLMLRRTLAGASQADLVRLTVWKHGSSLSRTTTRPAIGQQATFFPLGPLDRGAYVAVFELGGRVVAHVSFAMPVARGCRRGPSSAEPAPAWCGP